MVPDGFLSINASLPKPCLLGHLGGFIDGHVHFSSGFGVKFSSAASGVSKFTRVTIRGFEKSYRTGIGDEYRRVWTSTLPVQRKADEGGGKLLESIISNSAYFVIFQQNGSVGFSPSKKKLVEEGPSTRARKNRLFRRGHLLQQRSCLTKIGCIWTCLRGFQIARGWKRVFQ